MKTATEQLLLEKIQQGQDKALNKLYNEYYSACWEWVKKHFSVQELDFEDIYQDAVIILYEAARDGKLNDIKCSLKTYLFAICRNQMLSRFKLQRQQDDRVEEVRVYQREWLEPDEDISEEVELVRSVISETDEPCRSILTLSYYHNHSNEEIAERLGYPNKNVLKVQKSRCLNYLKKKVFKKWKKI